MSMTPLNPGLGNKLSPPACGEVLRFTQIRKRSVKFANLLLIPCLAAAVTFASPSRTKHVIIDKTEQILRAYEGERLVFQSRVSTGKWDRSTPNGTFSAGVKERMHYSSLYHRAPMPFSVQVTGNIFIHGFSYVPDWPDSHGCIRLPLNGDNPAKQFYDWVETGTRIVIKGKWHERPPSR